MTSWKTQVMPPSPVLRFWQLTNSIQSEGPNELCDGAWTAEQASPPTQPLSCEIQPFTCVLNRFLDKHLQASSCKYIRISIIFFHVGSHIEFSPLRKVKHKPKNLQKKRYKTNQRAANILCLQHDKHTSYWEEHSILTKSSGSHRTLVAVNSILNITFTNISQTRMFQGLMLVTSLLQQIWYITV